MIRTLKHLAYTLKVDINEFNTIIEKIDDYYYEDKEPKLKDGRPRLNKNGEIEYRITHPSKGRLKIIQKRINKSILSKIPMPKYAFGGVKRRDNVLHAKYHQGNKYFFNTDLKNFFPSIRHKRIFNLYKSYGFSSDVASVLTKLTTYKGKLPQGIPTSSCLANLVFENAGNKLYTYSKSNGMKFSTFVDDVVISSKADFKSSILDLLQTIRDEGFVINHKKTSYKTKNPEVTGNVVKANNLALLKKIQQKYNDPAISENSRAGLLLYIKRVQAINKSTTKKLLGNF